MGGLKGKWVVGGRAKPEGALEPALRHPLSGISFGIEQKIVFEIEKLTNDKKHQTTFIRNIF